jgi:hypothetical protein
MKLKEEHIIIGFAVFALAYTQREKIAELLGGGSAGSYAGFGGGTLKTATGQTYSQAQGPVLTPPQQQPQIVYLNPNTGQQIHPAGGETALVSYQGRIGTVKEATGEQGRKVFIPAGGSEIGQALLPTADQSGFVIIATGETEAPARTSQERADYQRYLLSEGNLTPETREKLEADLAAASD